MRLLRKAKQLVTGPLEHQYLKCLRAEVVASCGTLLDVGCGSNSPAGHLTPDLAWTVGVDAFRPALEESRAKGFHSEYLQLDIRALGQHFAPGSFDCVLASDVIEHLHKQEGLALISHMETIARKRVIIYTPNGFLPQGEAYGNPMQRHLSGWTVDEMLGLGFRVIGIEGLRPLRGEGARPRWRPSWFWRNVSLVTQPLVRDRPRLAFRLLCVKDVRM
ncbi:MAG: class I SAM-dependent methyltransferase [Anaerolineae bacterium]|nr:class I SAM-dependent methyltransferase [Anaerolineae bacterium]